MLRNNKCFAKFFPIFVQDPQASLIILPKACVDSEIVQRSERTE